MPAAWANAPTVGTPAPLDLHLRVGPAVGAADMLSLEGVLAAEQGIGLLDDCNKVVKAQQDILVVVTDLQDLKGGLGGIDALSVTLSASDTFVPHAADPANPDGRGLGLRLDWVRLEPFSS
jgi:hypothetical protein